MVVPSATTSSVEVSSRTRFGFLRSIAKLVEVPPTVWMETLALMESLEASADCHEVKPFEGASASERMGISE